LLAQIEELQGRPYQFDEPGDKFVMPPLGSPMPSPQGSPRQPNRLWWIQEKERERERERESVVFCVPRALEEEAEDEAGELSPFPQSQGSGATIQALAKRLSGSKGGKVGRRCV
jgi:hypothetical protein